MHEAANNYLHELEKELRIGRTTEHTHRPALKILLQSLHPRTTATNEPTRVACGAPDFVVSKMPGPITLGYVETKDVGKSLDEAETSEQLERYRHSLSNLVLTDYLEFRWYVNGEPRKTAVLAKTEKRGKLVLAATAVEAISLLTTF